MCECQARAPRKTRLTVIGFTTATVTLWGLAIGLRSLAGDQSVILLTGAAVASTVILAMTVTAGVARKRDWISADASAAEQEARDAENRAVLRVLAEALKNATDDVALVPPAPEDNRVTRPFRILRHPGA